MLVYLNQFRDDENGIEHADTDTDVDHDTDSYFDVESLSLDEWETVERNGRQLSRRAREFDGVAAISVPNDDDDGDVPGRTIQLRYGGEEEYVEHAEIVEVQDQNP